MTIEHSSNILVTHGPDGISHTLVDFNHMLKQVSQRLQAEYLQLQLQRQQLKHFLRVPRA